MTGNAKFYVCFSRKKLTISPQKGEIAEIAQCNETKKNTTLKRTRNFLLSKPHTHTHKRKMQDSYFHMSYGRHRRTISHLFVDPMPPPPLAPLFAEIQALSSAQTTTTTTSTAAMDPHQLSPMQQQSQHQSETAAAAEAVSTSAQQQQQCCRSHAFPVTWETNLCILPAPIYLTEEQEAHVKEFYICALCTLPLRDPVTVHGCGHTFCERCVEIKVPFLSPPLPPYSSSLINPPP